MERKQAFTHDYGARDDARLMQIRLHYGMTGIGIYWCIVEMLFEQDGTIPVASIEDIAFELNADIDIVRAIVNDFGLFENDGKMFWSPSATRRMEHRKRVSRARSQAGRMGGAPIGNANRKGETQEQTASTPAVPVPPAGKTEQKPKTTRFRPPTIDEVIAENQRRGFHIDAEAFVAFYESKDWMIGKNRMKSWKAAMVTWEKRNRPTGTSTNRPSNNNNVNDIWQ